MTNWTHHLADAGRVVTILWAFMFGAALLRFYTSKPRMPKLAVASMAFFLFFTVYVTVGNFNDAWEWGETPVALGALVCGTIGLWPYLAMRKPTTHPHPCQSSNSNRKEDTP